MSDYYETKDLQDFSNIGEYAGNLGTAYFDYYGKAMAAGALTECEKALIALAAATTPEMSLLHRRLYQSVPVPGCV